MAKPNWTPKLSDVLKHATVELEMHSDRTGNDYRADVIPVLQVRSTGNVEELDNGYWKYSIVDNQTNLEYEIKAPQQVNVKFGLLLEFTNVRGGATSRGGWYSCETVNYVPPQKNA